MYYIFFLCKYRTFGILIITAEFKIAFILKYFAFLDGEYGKGFFLFLYNFFF